MQFLSAHNAPKAPEGRRYATSSGWLYIPYQDAAAYAGITNVIRGSFIILQNGVSRFHQTIKPKILPSRIGKPYQRTYVGS